jgi:RNA polymerase sigma-70 factor (ECF subfamily)
MAWLSTIARYRALDLIRARRPEITEAMAAGDDDGPSLLEVESGAPRPEDQAAESQELAALQACLEGLSAEQRRAVLLSYYEGYTHSELAAKLATPIGTIKSWVRRGLQQLRGCLEGVRT